MAKDLTQQKSSELLSGKQEERNAGTERWPQTDQSGSEERSHPLASLKGSGSTLHALTHGSAALGASEPDMGASPPSEASEGEAEWAARARFSSPPHG